MKIPVLIDIEYWLRFFWTRRPVFIQHMRPSYSQFGEDVVVQSLFGNQQTGFYVDVGAYHPFLLSNTCLLSKRGWRGINVEPNPEAARLFRTYRKRDVNIACAVAEAEGESEFIVNGGYSGISGESYRNSSTGSSRTIQVTTMPLRRILDAHLPSDVTAIDLMSVDCEGLDLEVLRSNDWDRWRPRVLLVEDYSAMSGSEIATFMSQHDYHFYCQLGATSLYLEETEATRHLPTR